jgi:hypothetical protein
VLLAGPADRHGRPWPADKGRGRRLPFPAGCWQGRDGPTLGHRNGEGAPRPIARRCQAQGCPVEGELVALGGDAPAAEDDGYDGQHVRCERLEDEGLDQVEALDALILGAEPAGRGEEVWVEGGDRPGDGRPVEGDG